MDVAFRIFICIWLIVTAISVPTLLACLLMAPRWDDDPMDDYYRDNVSRADQGDQRQGLKTDDAQDATALEPADDHDGLMTQSMASAHGRVAQR